MHLRYDLNQRLEPRRPAGDLDLGFRAEVHDPVWFLGRQWQLGEHQGEDAASPVAVRVVAHQVPLDPYGGNPEMDPLLVPAEAIVESEAGDWWTLGRRARIGLTAAPHVPADLPPEQAATLRFANLAPPYDRLNGQYDGLALYEAWGDGLGLPAFLFAEVPLDPLDLWNPAELVYTAQFSTNAGAGITLDLPRHDGGDVDWYSVHASGPVPAPLELPAPIEFMPSRLIYPGAPHPRWWQIEDAAVDIGGFPPDRSHFATMLLIDLIVSHADDWFSFPLTPLQAETPNVGTIVTLHMVEVRDAFDRMTTLVPPANWSLFKVAGLDPTSLLIWPTVTTPLTGAALDEVVVGVDEDANLLWAVELRANGRELAPPPSDDVLPPTDGSGEVRADERQRYAYRASTFVPRFWHPYQIHDPDDRRRYVQARLANLELRPEPGLMPEPVSPLLRDPAAPETGPVHQIEPATIPTTGLRLDRRFVLGRQTDGRPVLWRQRRRLPLLGPPVSNLRFDVMEQELTLR